jgi:hypothetical protein
LAVWIWFPAESPGLGGYLALIIVGVFLPTIAIVGYLLLAILLIVPFGLRKQTSAVGPAADP